MELKRPKMSNPVHFLAFGFGSGLAPIAPGTFGTVAAMPIWWLCAQLPLWGYLAVTAAVIAVGPYLCGKTSNDMHVHDHPGIVWDEIAGLLITEPWPIGWLDRRVAGGLGIMVDDLLAGVYAAVIVQLLIWQFPVLFT